jgi:hypothetical protein
MYLPLICFVLFALLMAVVFYAAVRAGHGDK